MGTTKVVIRDLKQLNNISGIKDGKFSSGREIKLGDEIHWAYLDRNVNGTTILTIHSYHIEELGPLYSLTWEHRQPTEQLLHIKFKDTNEENRFNSYHTCALCDGCKFQNIPGQCANEYCCQRSEAFKGFDSTLSLW